MKSLHWLALTIVSICFWGPCLRAQDRVALLIGNNAYQHAKALANPIRDVTAVESQLKKNGVTTLIVQDGTKSAMLKAIDGLKSRSSKALVVMIYYAGHGVEMNGKNYLIPVDARVSSSRDLEAQAVSVDGLLRRMGESGVSSRILVLDCCRDAPFEGSILSPVEVGTLPPDTLVVFSGSSGFTVPDGPAGGHSPFADAFLKQLSPGKSSLNIVFSAAASMTSLPKPWIRFDGEAKSLAPLFLHPLCGTELPNKVSLRLLASALRAHEEENNREEDRVVYNRLYLSWMIGKQMDLINTIAGAYFPSDYFGPLGVNAYLEKEMEIVRTARAAAFLQENPRESGGTAVAYESAEAVGMELHLTIREMARDVASRTLSGAELTKWLGEVGITEKD